MKKRIKMTLLLLFVLVCCLGTTGAAGFKRMPNGRYRYYTSGKKYLAGKKSTVKESSARWVFKKLTYKGKVYTFCFDEKGYMQTGSKILYTKPAGAEAGWRKYRFDSHGRLLGELNLPGPVLKGKFVKNKKGIRYQLPDKTYLTKQWKYIDGYWYYFYSTGYMAKNTKVGSHYVDRNGHMIF